MGKRQLILFYVLSGVAGAASFAFLNAESFAPLIGASGAVAGMVGAVCFYSFVPSDPSNPMPNRGNRHWVHRDVGVFEFCQGHCRLNSG